MDDTTTDTLADLIGRIQAKIETANIALEAKLAEAIDQFEATLERPGVSADERNDHRVRMYVFMRILRGTYWQGYELADEALQRILPEAGEVTVTPIPKFDA